MITWLQQQQQRRPLQSCSLLPSVLGPDWYMVPLPIPTQYINVAGYQQEYVHMPCAITTVFDVAICGCTNLAAYMYTSIESKMAATNMLDDTGTMGLVKKRDPKDYSLSSKQIGSLLLNTRTWEVTECPFKASPRGVRWYLVREPSNMWMNMKCAEGTVFNKITCACQHAGVQTKDVANSHEDDIIILDHQLDNKISASLNIKVSDIDFTPEHDALDKVPFWRQRHRKKPATRKDTISAVKPDVIVTNAVTSGDKPRGEMASKSTSRRQSKLGRLVKRNQMSPLTIDSMETHTDKHQLSVVHDTSHSVNILSIPSTEVSSRRDTHDSADLKVTDLKVKFLPIDANADIKEQKTKKFAIDTSSAIINECGKKPIPDLGPDYFQMYVWEVGYIPYRCHSNRIYDDLRCACVTANTIIGKLTGSDCWIECSKKPVPELGPNYFKMNVWGVEYIPYRCHGNRVYDDSRCACVTVTGKDSHNGSHLYKVVRRGSLLGYTFWTETCYGTIKCQP